MVCRDIWCVSSINIRVQMRHDIQPLDISMKLSHAMDETKVHRVLYPFGGPITPDDSETLESSVGRDDLRIRNRSEFE